MARIIIIDDDPTMVQVISDICSEVGHAPAAFNSGEKALKAMEGKAPDLVITDVRMDGVGGMEVLRACRRDMPKLPVIMISANRQVQPAVEAMHAGAFDYIAKPFRVNELRDSIKRALEEGVPQAMSVPAELPKETQVASGSSGEKTAAKVQIDTIIGRSDRVKEMFRLVAKVANSDSTILIEGESGTGKELVAKALHYQSHRKEKPFVAINCSAMPENLLESELFGHRKGAFTGAVTDKIGLFEEAEGGTIFLDEVNSMSPLMQTKLLRVLQERTLRRVGDTKTIPIHVRVLAASNESLAEKKKKGTFREDLYYRLAVITVELPSLRDRMSDVPLLVEHFLKKYGHLSEQGEVTAVDASAMMLLNSYGWPGNVRELENAIERACVLCEGGVIRDTDLPPAVVSKAFDGVNGGESELNSGEGLIVGETLDAFTLRQEVAYINAAVRKFGGSRETAARVLGVSVATLYRKQGQAREQMEKLAGVSVVDVSKKQLGRPRKEEKDEPFATQEKETLNTETPQEIEKSEKVDKVVKVTKVEKVVEKPSKGVVSAGPTSKKSRIPQAKATKETTKGKVLAGARR